MRLLLLLLIFTTPALSQENTIITVRQFEGHDSLHPKPGRIETLNSLGQPLLKVYKRHIAGPRSFYREGKEVFTYRDTMLVEKYARWDDGDAYKYVFQHDTLTQLRIRRTCWDYEQQLKKRKAAEFKALDPDMGYETKFLAKFYSKKRVWKEIEHIDYTYYENGLLSGTYIDWAGQGEQFQYDSLGRGTMRYLINGDTVILAESIVYTAQTEESTLYFYEGSYPELVVSSLCHYTAFRDEQGRLVREQFAFDDNPPEITEYSYGPDGRLRKVVFYDDQGEPVATDLYEYTTKRAR